MERFRDARLKPPLVVDIYQELASRGIVSGIRPPRNILELCDLLQPEDRDRDVLMGKIHICDADGADEMQIRAMIDRIGEGCYKGAMGTSAKLLAERCGFTLDFTYGVIDKCILKAFIGRDCMIITSGGMVEHTLKRICDYSQESGAGIEAVRLLPP